MIFSTRREHSPWLTLPQNCPSVGMSGLCVCVYVYEYVCFVALNGTIRHVLCKPLAVEQFVKCNKPIKLNRGNTQVKIICNEMEIET